MVTQPSRHGNGHQHICEPTGKEVDATIASRSFHSRRAEFLTEARRHRGDRLSVPLVSP